MRLHRLEISAFGPFAGHTVIDFDALVQASVFLLCGDTGAGKSTVLDGVCFALYGDVPGDRGKAQQLRSHFAAPGARPQVVLEVTVSGRRLRFTRSPAWQRAKRRGTGLTTEQSRVLVEELEGDEWVACSTRLDEAGHLVTDLLGMNRDQFAQVALLPQGQFDRFLASTSEDRQRLLTQLFRTRRFEEVERWLVERRTLLRRESREHQVLVSARLHRTAEAAGVEAPESLVDGLDTTGVEVAIRDWAAGLSRDLRAGADLAERERAELEQAAGRSAEAHDRALAQHRWRERHHEATTVLSRLRDTRRDAEESRRRLLAARRAAPVAPLAARVTTTRSAAERAERAAGTALARVGSLLEPPDDSADLSTERDPLTLVAQRAAAATERATLARALVPRADELATCRRRRDEIDWTLEQLADERDRVAAQVAADPQIVGALAARLDAARAQSAEIPRLEEHSRTLRERSRHQADLGDLERVLVVARAQHRDRAHEHHDAREHHLDLRQRRLDGMAAELAHRLAVGQGCPVCGSDQHPAPAHAQPDAPSPDDERAAQSRLDDTVIALQTAREEVRSVETRIAVLNEALSAEDSASVGDHTTETLAEALEAARTARDLLPAVEQGQRQALADASERRRRATEISVSSAALVAERADLTARAERLADELHDLLTDQAETPTAEALRALAERHADAARALTAARTALEDRRRAEHDRDAAAAEAEAAAAAAGFLDLDLVARALLADDETERIEADLHRRDAEESDALAVLADPKAAAAAAGPAPDVDSAARERDTADQAHRQSVTRAARAVERRDDVARHVQALDHLLDGWHPVRDQLEMVRSVSELAEGKGADNTAQMRLSAYVLAARLSQVVAAANERLGVMSDERYLLEHTARRGVGERRGGLSLVVRDLWTDESRDPVTLSGGETFLVSLALALGLSDVVTAEAGGARIETLFVDEGFGSLDPDALELVMDTLDQLREGGRAVGVVSHVPELRDRIGTQLMVHKGPTGSWVTQGADVGR